MGWGTGWGGQEGRAGVGMRGWDRVGRDWDTGRGKRVGCEGMGCMGWARG